MDKSKTSAYESTQAGKTRVKGAPTRINDVSIVVFAVVLLLSLLGAFVGLLFAFDGNPIFESHGVTLNTLVAVISAVSKASILYAVSFAIGQAKWTAFSRHRRLLDFERIDSASRGAPGSLRLLGNTSVRGV